MKLLKQSSSLQQVFQAKIQDKISDNRQEFKQSLGGGFLGEIGAGLFQFQQIKNQIKGNVGESLLVQDG